MFNSIGMFEIALIAGIALMVLGPEKFPGFAKLSVRTFRDLKKYLAETQREIASELNPMKKEFEGLKKVDIEGYVEKLIGDDEKKGDKKNDTTSYDDEDEIEGDYNGEPEIDVMGDWYPEDHNEIMPGGDETADMNDESVAEGSDDSEPETDFPDDTVPYEAPANTDLSSGDELDGILPDRDDDFDMAGGYDSREEVVDAENPERLES
jgi:Sec-independent protein translocase protein TatA